MHSSWAPLGNANEHLNRRLLARHGRGLLLPHNTMTSPTLVDDTDTNIDTYIPLHMQPSGVTRLHVSMRDMLPGSAGLPVVTAADVQLACARARLVNCETVQKELGQAAPRRDVLSDGGEANIHRILVFGPVGMKAGRPVIRQRLPCETERSYLVSVGCLLSPHSSAQALNLRPQYAAPIPLHNDAPSQTLWKFRPQLWGASWWTREVSNTKPGCISVQV
jgi:hypothetical protein